jgi:hypothetical protein
MPLDISVLVNSSPIMGAVWNEVPYNFQAVLNDLIIF